MATKDYNILLQALKDGDHKAYESVFLEYYGPVKQFLSALMRSHDDAEELCQDLFANLWIKREQIDPSKNIKGYLYNSARNGAMNYFRSHKVRDAYKSSSWFSEETISSDEIIIAKETELLIGMVVSRMPNQRRNVYELSRKQGLSNDEIAIRLNVTKNAVERHISLALKDIRKVLVIFVMFFLSR